MIFTSQPKIWGKTTIVFEIPGVIEVHRIQIVSGGYSSKHRHETKYNAFYCESGLVDIISYEGEHEHHMPISSGMMTTVKAGMTHKFNAMKESVVYEIYYSPMISEDIQRDDTGGITRPKRV